VLGALQLIPSFVREGNDRSFDSPCLYQAVIPTIFTIEIAAIRNLANQVKGLSCPYGLLDYTLLAQLLSKGQCIEEENPV
jgi:hypothetical protein